MIGYLLSYYLHTTSVIVNLCLSEYYFFFSERGYVLDTGSGNAASQRKGTGATVFEQTGIKRIYFTISDHNFGYSHWIGRHYTGKISALSCQQNG